MKVSAVIVTRGGHYKLDADMMQSLRPFDEIIVWDNLKAPKDVKVYGRFMGAMLACNRFVYVQDDDCVVDAVKVASLATSGKVICNMPAERRPEYEGTGVALIGWGTVFEKSLITSSFDEYLKRWPQDELFERECDRLFTYVNRRRTVLIEATMRHLPTAHGMDRMGREDRHRNDLLEIRRRARDLDDAYVPSREALGVQVV